MCQRLVFLLLIFLGLAGCYRERTNVTVIGGLGTAIVDVEITAKSRASRTHIELLLPDIVSNFREDGWTLNAPVDRREEDGLITATWQMEGDIANVRRTHRSDTCFFNIIKRRPGGAIVQFRRCGDNTNPIERTISFYRSGSADFSIVRQTGERDFDVVGSIENGKKYQLGNDPLLVHISY